MPRAEKIFHVYILASRPNGTLYTGVTSDLVKRVWEHREGLVAGFTRRYNVHRLVWFEAHAEAIPAITREKQIKRWNRAWKVALIMKENPQWRDRYAESVGETVAQKCTSTATGEPDSLP